LTILENENFWKKFLQRRKLEEKIAIQKFSVGTFLKSNLKFIIRKNFFGHPLSRLYRASLSLFDHSSNFQTTAQTRKKVAILINVY
jgi:hypothetical protein